MSTAPVNVVTMAVGPDGSLALSLNGRPVLTGVLGLHGPLGVSDAWPGGTVTGSQADPNHAAVTVVYPGVTVTSDLTLTGTDLSITTTVQNATATPITPLNLTGLRYQLAGPATGTLKCWDSTEVNSTGLNTYHPSMLNPVGATTVTDGTTHVIAWSASDVTSDHPSLLLADFAANELLPANRVTLCTQRTVAPGAAITVNLTFRLTSDGSTAGLYSGYRNAMHAALSGDLIPATGLAHVPHPGPAAQFASVNATWAGADNIGGYNDGGGATWRRLDLPAGAAAFPSVVGKSLAAAKGTSVIFWSPGGFEPEIWTRDSAKNLARIAPTFPTAVAGLKALGLRVGVCLRIADLYDPVTGVGRRVDSHNAADVANRLAQLDALTAAGATAFYFDDCGADPDSTRMIVLARRHLGPDALVITEQGNDVSACYCDRYTESTTGGLLALDSETQAVLRYIWPGWRSMAISRTADPLFKGGADDLLIEDFQATLLPAVH